MKMSSSTLLLVFAIILCPGWLVGQEASLVKYKAAFLYHFIDFVTWPEEDSTDVFRVGILGDTEVADVLREIGSKKPVGGRKLAVESYTDIDRIQSCQLLFITSPFADDVDRIKEALHGRSVLTVSDTPGLARAGVAINLTLIRDQLRFEINRNSLETAGLRASAQLLKLAILVDERDPQ